MDPAEQHMTQTHHLTAVQKMYQIRKTRFLKYTGGEDKSGGSFIPEGWLSASRGRLVSPGNIGVIGSIAGALIIHPNTVAW